MTDTRTAPQTSTMSWQHPRRPSRAATGMRSIINPATGEVIASVPEHGVADVDKAVAIARATFESGPWPELTRTARARLLLRFADAIEANRRVAVRIGDQEQRSTDHRDQGAVVPGTGMVPVQRRPARDPAGRGAAQRRPLPDLPAPDPARASAASSPRSTIPMLILARSLSAALATGNTVVVKPSELTPLTTLALVDILYAAGLPEGVVSVVTGGRVAGERLTRHPDVAKITLTGGTEAGRAAAVATASRFARVTARTRRQDPDHRLRRHRPAGRRRGRGVRRLRRGRSIVCRRRPDSWCSAASMTNSSPR